MNYKLILASQSPRRRQLLAHLGIPFEVASANCTEVAAGMNAQDIASTNAKLKALDVYNSLKFSMVPNPLVVGADTVVHIDNTILGKPCDIDEARRMLLTLENAWHEVITAVYIKTTDKERLFGCVTKVHFGAIDSNALEQYLGTKDSLDKAGAYGVQGAAQMFIDEINGSYSNVVGFPLSVFVSELKKIVGCDSTADYRKVFI